MGDGIKFYAYLYSGVKDTKRNVTPLITSVYETFFDNVRKGIPTILHNDEYEDCREISIRVLCGCWTVARGITHPDYSQRYGVPNDERRFREVDIYPIPVVGCETTLTKRQKEGFINFLNRWIFRFKPETRKILSEDFTEYVEIVSKKHPKYFKFVGNKMVLYSTTLTPAAWSIVLYLWKHHPDRFLDEEFIEQFPRIFPQLVYNREIMNRDSDGLVASIYVNKVLWREGGMMSPYDNPTYNGVVTYMEGEGMNRLFGNSLVEFYRDFPDWKKWLEDTYSDSEIYKISRRSLKIRALQDTLIKINSLTRNHTY